MHVVNVKDSAVQILQSLWMMVMMTWIIETNTLPLQWILEDFGYVILEGPLKKTLLQIVWGPSTI